LIAGRQAFFAYNFDRVIGELSSGFGIGEITGHCASMRGRRFWLSIVGK